MRRQVPAPLFGLLLLTAGCIDGGAPETTEPVATSTHALVRIERSAFVGADADATGLAFAGVVRVPEMSDPEPLLRMSGKGVTLPGAGMCIESARERDAALLSNVGRAEFLEAGDVLLRADLAETLLAPRLFESSQAELSGVVYTSRDRASEPLPGGASYVLKTGGSEQLPPFEVRVKAPELLSDVTINAEAIEELVSVPLGDDLAVTWSPGDSRDTVYVEVAGSELGTLGVCVFRDSDGIGMLPKGLFGARGPGSLTLHRLREVAADVRAVDAAEVRFDFELTAEVAFQ